MEKSRRGGADWSPAGHAAGQAALAAGWIEVKLTKAGAVMTMVERAAGMATIAVVVAVYRSRLT